MLLGQVRMLNSMLPETKAKLFRLVANFIKLNRMLESPFAQKPTPPSPVYLAGVKERTEPYYQKQIFRRF